MPGGSGGMFKRLKAKQKKTQGRQKRGSKGLSKEARRLKHNAMVDLYNAKRQIEDIDKVSVSSDEPEMSSSASSSSSSSASEGGGFSGVLRGKQHAGPGTTKPSQALLKLRGMLGVSTSAGKRDANKGTTDVANAGPMPSKRGKTGKEGDDDSDSGDSNVTPPELHSSYDGSDSEGLGADSDDDGHQPASKKDEEDVTCSACNQRIADNDEAAVACMDCKQTFCGNCYSLAHQPDEAKQGHKVVRLVELDDGAEAEEENEELDDDESNEGDEEDADASEDEGGNGDDEDEDGALSSADEDAYDDVEGAAEVAKGESLFLQSYDFSAAKLHPSATMEATAATSASAPDASAEPPQPARATAVRAGATAILPLDDPFLSKYILDTHGSPDLSKMQPVDASINSNQSIIAPHYKVSLSTSARLRLLEAPTAHAAVTEGKKKLSKKKKTTRESSSVSLLSSSGIAATAADATKATPSFVNPALWSKWLSFKTNSANATAKTKAATPTGMSPTEVAYLKMLSSYADVHNAFRYQPLNDTERLGLREVTALHVLNHVFKAKAAMAANDALIRKRREERLCTQVVGEEASKGTNKKRRKEGKKGKSDKKNQEGGAGAHDDDDDEDEDVEGCRDRGFGNCRVLVLLPTRNYALRFVDTLMDILCIKDKEAQHKYKMFHSDFSELEETLDPSFRRRPLDYRIQFEGNINDAFCFGVRLPSTKSCRLYSHVLNSDIIVASPLGLRARAAKKADYQVALSSIELVVIDQADVLLMQNWTHVTSALLLLNKRPTSTTFGLNDMRRVYQWAIQGRCGRHRQTVLSTQFTHPMFQALLRNSMNNSGKVVAGNAKEDGTLQSCPPMLRQTFLRFDADSVEDVDDARFDFFANSVFPSKIKPLVERNIRTILFIPSYFDFVRVRGFCHEHCRDNYSELSEYTPLKEQRKALGKFTDGERTLLLLSERFYFFKRYFVKLAEALVFYSPVLNCTFYPQLLGKLTTTSPNAATITVFSRFDAHELSRIVGRTKAGQMLERQSDAFVFIVNQ